MLWAVGDRYYHVIECKSGATADRIWRRDAEQLAHSANWFAEEYDRTCRATPVLVHRVNTLKLPGSAATLPATAGSPTRPM